MPLCPADTGTPASGEHSSANLSSAEPSTAQSSAEQSHCGSASDKDPEKAVDTVMLFADCTGVDLQASSLLLPIDEPQFSSKPADYGAADLWLIKLNDEARINKSRAPPKPQNNFNPQKPIYLKTQRVRL